MSPFFRLKGIIMTRLKLKILSAYGTLLAFIHDQKHKDYEYTTSVIINGCNGYTEMYKGLKNNTISYRLACNEYRCNKLSLRLDGVILDGTPPELRIVQ